MTAFPSWRARAVALAFSALALPAWAANPLTPAEREVCHDLGHCLAIVDAHAHDAFDYAVLADAFARFGERGRTALIRRISRGGAKGGHAADLLVRLDPPLDPRALDDVLSRTSGPTRALVERTRAELAAPRRAVAFVPKPAFADAPSRPICALGEPVLRAAQAREMPFFEADIARPDREGRYRPSPEMRIEQPQTDRANLNSAISRVGGWLAAYQGGLVYYDGESGAPTLIQREPVHSLQRMRPGQIDSGVWAISQEPERIVLIDARPPRPRIVATVPGRLAEMRRGVDDSLFVSSHHRVTLRLHPDGHVSSGCTEGNA